MARRRRSRISRRVSATATRAYRRVRSVASRARRRVSASPVVQYVAAPVRRVGRRVSASRVGRFVSRRRAAVRERGMNWRTIGRDLLLNSAGGVASKVLGVTGRVISQQTQTAIDDSPVAQAALKGAIGFGFNWLFGGSPSVREFVAGMNGANASDLFDVKVVKPILEFAGSKK